MPVPENQLGVLLDLSQSRLWDIEPAFRAENVGVWTEDVGIAMDSPNRKSVDNNNKPGSAVGFVPKRV